MSTNFDVLNSADKDAARPKKAATTNVFMKFERVEPAKDGVRAKFHGFDMVTGEAISVQLMTAEEAAARLARKEESPDEALARLGAQIKGSAEKRRPNPLEFTTKGNKLLTEPGGVLAFERCYKQKDGGYVAYWPVQLAANAEEARAGLRSGIVNINKTQGGAVFASMLYPEEAFLLSKDTIMGKLGAAFSSETPDGETRRGQVLFRVLRDNAVVFTSLVRAGMSEQKSIDPNTGEAVTVKRPEDMQVTMARMYSPEGVQGAPESTEHMAMRAVLHGYAGKADSYPDFSSAKPAVAKELLAMTEEIRAGSLQVEAIPGEITMAGKASSVGLLKSFDDPKNPVNSVFTAYKKMEDGTRRWAGQLFVPAVLCTEGADWGGRYFTKYVTEQSYPRGVPLAGIMTKNVKAVEAVNVAETSNEIDDERSPSP